MTEEKKPRTRAPKAETPTPAETPKRPATRARKPKPMAEVEAVAEVPATSTGEMTAAAAIVNATAMAAEVISANRAPAPPAAIDAPKTQSYSLISEQDLFLFNQGTHYRLYDHLGAHLVEFDGTPGVYFAVWAPNADYVAVIGDFNGWYPGTNPLAQRGQTGIWEGFVPGVQKGATYKYHIASPHGGFRQDKTDPFGLYQEVAPQTGSIVWDREYTWNDGAWMAERAARQQLSSPMSVYELHLGSWQRDPEQPERLLSYRELAPRLASYITEMGYTHIELLPITEHPFYGSWGYQATGFFTPTSRYGTPQDFMYFVDYLHQHGIGIILDWVPSHFPTDGHGLAFFDGTHLYEHADPRKGFHPDWGSFIFNYGRNEVRAFLISSALCWLEKFHIDGLRVDAVASMLYLDYSRKAGEWIPNEYGGNENLEAIAFLRQFNAEVYKHYPDVQTIAEESTAWPMVSRPLYVGGLGFGMKWDMGWMHDTLAYFQRDPIFRRFHHNELTFRGLYAFSENFVLPLSHDEVVHGKGSILDKMSGDHWQKFANLRLLYSYMYATPAKKLLFMGSEFGQWREWRHDESLDWHLLEFPSHQGLKRLTQDLNRLYRTEPALHELDFDPTGMEWIDANDADGSVYVFARKAKNTADTVLAVFNATPIVRENYRIGVPRGGWWHEIFNSDSDAYWGSGIGNAGGVHSEESESHGRTHSLTITLPPLGALYFVSRG